MIEGDEGDDSSESDPGPQSGHRPYRDTSKSNEFRSASDVGIRGSASAAHRRGAPANESTSKLFYFMFLFLLLGTAWSPCVLSCSDAREKLDGLAIGR